MGADHQILPDERNAASRTRPARDVETGRAARSPDGRGDQVDGSAAALSRLGGQTQGQGRVLMSGWRSRLRYFTWTYFTLVMATGGIANAINSGIQTLAPGPSSCTTPTAPGS